MEGKAVIMSVVLVSLLVLGQIQVEAQTRSCCPSTSARNIYNTCRFAGGSQSLCASTSGCRRLNGNCPTGWTYDMLQNTAPAAGFTSCCPNATARAYFQRCRLTPAACAENSGCFLLRGMTTCPAGWTYQFLQNTAPGDNAVNEYCKSGCVSSVCAAIATLQDSDASEVVNGAVEKCTDACTDFCTKKASVITTLVSTA